MPMAAKRMAILVHQPREALPAQRMRATTSAAAQAVLDCAKTSSIAAVMRPAVRNLDRLGAAFSKSR